MKFSVVVPAYNEAANIVSAVEKFVAACRLPEGGTLHEIILVENGSRDSTFAEIERLAGQMPGLVRPERIGRGSYGEAIRHGMLSATGTHVIILECDFMQAEFLNLCHAEFKRGAPFVVASKRHLLSRDERGLKRRLLTLGFNLILNVFFRYPGTDTHGLKGIEAGLARRLCELAITTDEIFQTEIVLLAWRMGYQVAEVPITVAELRSPTVSVTRRLPKVANIVRELRISLARELPKKTPQ